VRQFRTAVLGLAALALVGCKDATLGPSGAGSIEGVVLDAEGNRPIAGASITSTPPSHALVTDAQGRFVLDDLEAGNYQITARGFGYQQTTVTVAVRPHRAATATVFLQRQEPDARRVALDVEVLSFWNTVQGDSVFAEAEYRVRNSGEVKVNAYDVSFRIATTEGVRFQQEKGQALQVAQSDIRRFKLLIQRARATEVQVESVWTDPGLTPPN
jgi:hypothetical protein